MTARDEVESILSERGPATVAEIAEALSNIYTPHTVSVAVARLKKAGTVVLTGDKVQGGRGRPAEVVALNRELERARSKREALSKWTQTSRTDDTLTYTAWVKDADSPWGSISVSVPNTLKPSVWQRVKRLFGVGR